MSDKGIVFNIQKFRHPRRTGNPDNRLFERMSSSVQMVRQSGIPAERGADSLRPEEMPALPDLCSVMSKSGFFFEKRSHSD